LIGIATPAAQALANATSKTPIIMGAVTDPVGANLIKNVDAPEGNITGVSDQFPVAKQVQLMTELTPDLKTVGVLYSSSEDNSKSQVEAFKKATEAKGMTIKEYAVSNTNDITATMNVLASQVEALYVPTDNTIASAFSTVVQVAKEAKLPVFPSVDSMVKEGGLAAVAIDQYQLGVATGDMAADVLDGVAIKDLPVNFFTDVTPMINETVATELGITIPDSVKATATLVK
jgi:putative ABC transport system substrate-binding protein